MAELDLAPNLVACGIVTLADDCVAEGRVVVVALVLPDDEVTAILQSDHLAATLEFGVIRGVDLRQDGHFAHGVAQLAEGVVDRSKPGGQQRGISGCCLCDM